MGYAFNLVPPSLTGPRLISQWISESTRKLVGSSLGGGVYALGKMADHMSLLRDSFAPFAGLGPGMVALEDSEIFFPT